jgi:aspartate aminotransferase
LGSAGFEIAEYPYYDTATREVNIDLMLETLRQVPAGDWWCFTAAVTTPLAPI